MLRGCLDCTCNKDTAEEVVEIADARPHDKIFLELGERDESVPTKVSSSALQSPTAASSTPTLRPPGTPVHQAGLPADVVESLEEIDKRRLEGWPFDAERRLVALLDFLSQAGQTRVVDLVTETDVYIALVKQMEEANSLLTTLLDEEGWKLQKEDNKVFVWTRPEKGTNIVTVRLAGVCEGPFDHFCALNKEVALVKTWMPGVKSSIVLKQLNDFEQVCHYVWKFPILTARDFLIEETCLVNDTEGYTIAKRSPPTPREGLQLPPVQKHCIRGAITNCCSFSAPIGDQHIFICSVLNVDFKAPLPTRLVNYLSVAMGVQSFKDMEKNVRKSLDPKTEIYKSVQNPENDSYYGRMKAVEKVGEAKAMSCREELLATGWVKDPVERRKLFARSGSGVLVPMS